jgi:F-type H+-transporting ATPase subunit gamma
MADSTSKLRRKIGSASDLQSVVRAMKAQAAANVGQYAESVAAIGDYARNVEVGLGACFRLERLSPTTPLNPLAVEDRPIRAVVFGSDQGLVGRFNDAVVEYARHALAALPVGAQIWAVGERVRASLADSGMTAEGTFPVPSTVQAITRLVTDILVAVVDRAPIATQPDSPFELHLFHNHPTTGSAYAPTGQRLLPLDAAWRLDLAARPWPTALPPELLGNSSQTMRGLIREHIFASIFKASAASLASENASRLAAMERADRNIDTMLQVLQDQFHRLRQSKIDEELSDVIAGFKALGR